MFAFHTTIISVSDLLLSWKTASLRAPGAVAEVLLSLGPGPDQGQRQGPAADQDPLQGAGQGPDPGLSPDPGPGEGGAPEVGGAGERLVNKINI